MAVEIVHAGVVVTVPLEKVAIEHDGKIFDARNWMRMVYATKGRITNNVRTDESRNKTPYSCSSQKLSTTSGKKKLKNVTKRLISTNRSNASRNCDAEVKAEFMDNVKGD